MNELNKQTKYFIIIATIAIAVILTGILTGIKKEETKRNIVEYNYFKFEQIGGLWQTAIALDDELYEAVFRYNPEQVKDVYITGNLTGLQKTPIYITFDPESGKEEFKYLALAASELTLHLIRALNFTVEAACTKNKTEACYDRPIITCADNASVISLVPNPPTQITLEGDCVTLSGEGMELLKSTDRLLFQWYKVMSKQTR